MGLEVKHEDKRKSTTAKSCFQSSSIVIILNLQERLIFVAGLR